MVVVKKSLTLDETDIKVLKQFEKYHKQYLNNIVREIGKDSGFVVASSFGNKEYFKIRKSVNKLCDFGILIKITKKPMQLKINGKLRSKIIALVNIFCDIQKELEDNVK